MTDHDLYSIPNLGGILVTDIGPLHRHLRWVTRYSTEQVNEDPFAVPTTWLQPEEAPE